MLNRIMRSSLLGMVCAALAGCATNAGNAGLECGAGGLALGFLACKLAGGSDAQCAAVGVGVGAVGAVGCSTYSKHLDDRRKTLAGRENSLDAQIQYVQGLNSDTRQLNTELAKRVNTSVQDTNKLVAQIQQQQVSNQRLAQKRKAQDDLIKASQDEVDKGTQALQTAKELRARRRQASPELDSAIAQQEQLLSDAQSQVNLLTAQRERV
jgi:hypothetical protein